jgi:hypothetical protein
MNVLDIGGGFQFDYLHQKPDIDDFFQPVLEALGRLPEQSDWIAETRRFCLPRPSRAFAA